MHFHTSSVEQVWKVRTSCFHTTTPLGVWGVVWKKPRKVRCGKKSPPCLGGRKLVEVRPDGEDAHDQNLQRPDL